MEGYLRKLVEEVNTSNSKLDKKTRIKINDEMRKVGLDGNGKFESIGRGLNKISEVLSNFGIEWDDTLNAHLFMSDQGTRLLDIAFSNKDDISSPTSISNSAVSFSWYKREPDNYEITAYLS